MPSKWTPTPKQQSTMTLFGVDYEQAPDEWNVKFGTQHVPLLNQSDTSDDGFYYPTTTRLVNHLGLLQAVYDNPKLMEAFREDLSEWERRKASAHIELERKVLAPIRKQLERRYHFSFYRSASVKYEPDKKTGLVSITALGEPMVKVLPLSVQVAQMRGMGDRDIALIAPEVMYVLEKKKIAHRSVHDETELLALIDGWLVYVKDPKVRKRLYESFKKMTPCIVGRKVTQLLLHA